MDTIACIHFNFHPVKNKTDGSFPIMLCNFTTFIMCNQQIPVNYVMI